MVDKDEVIAELVHTVALLVQRELKGDELMAIGQEILDAVAAETTVIDSFIALVRGLVTNNTIDSATAAKIMTAIATDRAKIEAAIVENTPPPAGP